MKSFIEKLNNNCSNRLSLGHLRPLKQIGEQSARTNEPLSSFTPSSSIVNPHTEVTREVQEPINGIKAMTVVKGLKIVTNGIQDDINMSDQ